jgi:CheY-like chemotaxis protein
MEGWVVRPTELVLALMAALLVGAALGYYLRGWIQRREQERIRRARGELQSRTAAAATSHSSLRPRHRPPASPGLPASGPATSPGSTVEAASAANRGPVVLIVDDRFELRAVNGAYLSGHGYRIVEAADGDAAIEVARREHPDAILLDHSLPRRTGLEVVQELKADPDTAAIPIVFMTAHSYGAVGRSAMAAGCAAFLPKPCDPSRVLQEIARHARGPIGRA